ncbi:MAG: sigma-70 family RNA polymerase sigma factor [Planctomycetes bacterium]|nr:sigma-70 family RNA polymerase sigma factor [Planctomycetota bacterium]
MSDPTQQTLAAAAAGDPDAWRQLVEAYSGRVYGLLYRQCGNADLAEEMTQATFAKIVSKLAAYDEQGRFEAWLFRIAVNRLRDELRRRKRQAVSIDFDATPPEAMGQFANGPTPTDALEKSERIAQLRAAVERLSEPDRELLDLRFTAGLSFAQIAEVLEQPLGTVLARGHRALKKLRDMLEETEP